MLWTIVVILAVMWLLGMVSSYTLGGAIHLLLLLAVAVILFKLLSGRRALGQIEDHLPAQATRAVAALPPVPAQ